MINIEQIVKKDLISVNYINEYIKIINIIHWTFYYFFFII